MYASKETRHAMAGVIRTASTLSKKFTVGVYTQVKWLKCPKKLCVEFVKISTQQSNSQHARLSIEMFKRTIGIQAHAVDKRQRAKHHSSYYLTIHHGQIEKKDDKTTI